MSAYLIVQLRCDAPGCDNRLTIPIRDVAKARDEASRQRDWAYRHREDLCRVHARAVES